MGRAISIASAVVFCSFAFVLFQLWIRRPASVAVPRGPVPLLESREDGAVYAVSVQMDKFEKRLIDEEKRWGRLQTQLDAIQKDHEDLQKSVDDLEGEVRRLRRQVERNAAPTQPRSTLPPANAPNGPASGPVDGGNGGTPAPPIR
jgi:hypothetical protein